MNMLVSDLKREQSPLGCILYDFIPNFSDKTINKFYRKLDRNGKLYTNKKEKEIMIPESKHISIIPATYIDTS